MSHPYTFDYPASVRPEIVRFFQDFYQLSDTPNVDDQYPTRFTEDGSFVIGPRVSHGRTGKPALHTCILA